MTSKFKNSCNIEAIACPELVQIAENDLITNKEICINQLNSYFKQFDMNKIDTIVLGCTHFIFYKEYIREILGHKHLIVDGNLGTAIHLRNELSKKNLLSDRLETGTITFMNSQIVDKTQTCVLKKELSEKLYNNFK